MENLGNRLHVKIQDVGNDVYQVSESVLPRPKPTEYDMEQASLVFDYVAEPFSFTVSRAESKEILFDTSAASLVFESQYLRLRTRLPADPNLYGLGEHSEPLRLKTTDCIRTLWSNDYFGVSDDTQANLYGNHPVYFEHRTAGTHGVFLLNSNGMDVVINKTESSGQYLEYNTLGGVFDFYFLAGPSPTEVARQYAEVVGLPAMMPYWGFGFHNCRYGYRDAYDVAEMVYNYSQASIPLETVWTDIDYMDRRRVFSLDPERFPLPAMRELIHYLHEHGQHYIMMVDPAVAYQEYPPFQRGVTENVFLLRNNGSIWQGVVWPGITAYPDWFSANASRYWTNEFAVFFSAADGVDIDGLWIDMNEPSNFPCFFPCDDPAKYAVGLPPEPPPVRSPPRPLPGFPCSFQPPDSDCNKKGSMNRLLWELQRKMQELRNVQCAPKLGNIKWLPKLGRSLPESSSAALPDGGGPFMQDKETNQRVLSDGQQLSGKQKGLPGRDLLFPKYAIHNAAAYKHSWNAARGGISNKTVNTDVVHQNGLAMYDTHNLYGTMMSAASRTAMLARRPDVRPLIITRSTFAGAGAHVGKWLGDNDASWTHYRASIAGMLGFAALFQVPMVGSDVCGFGGHASAQLCARWAMLGAFSPFFRNHNAAGFRPQEFYRWDVVAEAARRAIDVRYRLLDYIYTAMHRQSVDGTPLVSPMFFAYPRDAATFGIDLQYFYGPALLVAPVTEEDADSVGVYLPKDEVFYNWWTHERIRGNGSTVKIRDLGWTDIPLFLRGGVIVPLRRRSAMTTAALRGEDFELLVPVGADGRAEGRLYLDDGESLVQDAVTLVEFVYENEKLTGKGEFGYLTKVKISRIVVLGEEGKCGNDEGATAEKAFSVDVPLTGQFTLDLARMGGC